MEELNKITEKIISCAIEVHRNLGPGLLESIYQQCLAYELSRVNIPFLMEQPIPVQYKGKTFDCGFRADMVVNDLIILELKAIDKLMPIHDAQLLTYLKLTGKKLGLIINFNVRLLKSGIRRLVL